MARWTECLGSRKWDRGARPRSDLPTSGGEPGLGGPPAPTASVATEWQLSGLPRDPGPSDAQQPVRSGDPQRPTRGRLRPDGPAQLRGVSAARELHLRAGRVEPPNQDRTSPSRAPEGTAATRSHSGIVIGRYQATVVVTVHGDLDHPRTAHLGHVLADLIDGQGNLSLLVDLGDATAADARQMSVFADADKRARQHGGSITLSKPPAPLHEALRQQGLFHLVEPLPPQRAPAAEASPQRERKAHPTGGSPSVSSGVSHQ